MKKNKSDEELLRRLRDEAPELLDAEISIDLDEAVEVLISADPNSINLNPKRRKKPRRLNVSRFKRVKKEK